MNKICVIIFIINLLLLEIIFYSIPFDKIDEQKIYFGIPNKFSKVSVIDYEKAFKSLSEYEELDTVEKGTAKYWIKVNRITEILINTINNIAITKSYDLIVEKNYWEQIVNMKDIPYIDITNEVINIYKQIYSK